MKRKSIIIIGNSINRLNGKNKSWEDIVKEWEIVSEIEGDEEWKKSSRLPFVYRASRVTNMWSCEDGDNNEGRNELFTKSFAVLCNSLLGYEINEQQKEIIKAFSDCEIMTTNYDYSLEKALGVDCPKNRELVVKRAHYREEMDMEILGNLNRKYKNIWHIHGEAYKPASIVMDADSYIRELNNLRLHGHNKGTWMYEFLNSDVYIIGLNLNHHEMLLMYALQERMKLSKEERHEVTFFRFMEKKDNMNNTSIEDKDQELLLKSMDVDVKDVIVKESYGNTWMNLSTELRKKVSGNGKSADENRRVLKRRWGVRNIVSSSTASMVDASLCWMNISVDKLTARELSGGNWIFEFLIDYERYAYIYPVDELQKEFDQKNVKKIMNKPERYSFYVDYSNGILYDSPSLKKKEIIKLQSIPPEDIEKYIYPVSKA